MVLVLHTPTKSWDQVLSHFFFIFGTELADFDELRKPKLNGRFRSETADVVALSLVHNMT